VPFFLKKKIHNNFDRSMAKTCDIHTPLPQGIIYNFYNFIGLFVKKKNQTQQIQTANSHEQKYNENK
jgi:hypothetical protein